MFVRRRVGTTAAVMAPRGPQRIVSRQIGKLIPWLISARWELVQMRFRLNVKPLVLIALCGA